MKTLVFKLIWGKVVTLTLTQYLLNVMQFNVSFRSEIKA